MNLKLARNLLVRSARLYDAKSSALSQQEITSKLNEIKFLADKKKASKLTIKKEIQSLEHKLEGVFEMQKNMNDEKKKQGQKESLLKKKIADLEHQLELGKDKAIHKRVERLSSILAEHIVQKKVAKDIHHLRAAKHLTITQHEGHNKSTSLKETSTEHHEKINHLQVQLDNLKSTLELKKNIFDKQQQEIIEEKIHLLEIRLGMHQYYHEQKEKQMQNQNENETADITNQTTKQSIESAPPPQKTKHTVLLTPPPKIEGMPSEIHQRTSPPSFLSTLQDHKISEPPKPEHHMQPPPKREI